MEITNNILIRCNRCGEEILIEKDYFELSTYSDERPMGPEVAYIYTHDLICDNCRNNIYVEIRGYEYPVGAFNYSDNEIKGATFVVNPEIDVVYYDFEYNDFDSEYYRPVIDKVQELKERLNFMSPRDFEIYISDYFASLGYETILTKQTRDGGFDMILSSKYPVELKILVECKKWSEQNKVDIGVIRSLYGVHSSEKVNKSIVVTTSRFTKDAIEFAEQQKTQIELIDIDELVKRLV